MRRGHEKHLAQKYVRVLRTAEIFIQLVSHLTEWDCDNFLTNPSSETGRNTARKERLVSQSAQKRGTARWKEKATRGSCKRTLTDFADRSSIAAQQVSIHKRPVGLQCCFGLCCCFFRSVSSDCSRHLLSK